MAACMASKSVAIQGSAQEQALWNTEYKALALDKKASGEDLGCLAITMQLGYTAEMLKSVPKDGQQGIMCGCPPAHLKLRPGMTTLDLGCGAGTDVILCGLQVQGSGGRAIGLDILPEMAERASANAASTAGLAAGATEFRICNINEGELASNFEDASLDVVTSNCVVCLFHQDVVFPTIINALKPGGVFCFAESMLKAPFPEDSAMFPLFREAYEKNIYPDGRDAACKAFRASIACTHQNPMSFGEVEKTLLKFGFAEVEKCADLASPQGLCAKPFPAPTLACEGMSSEELADFQARVDAAWCSYDLDAHVHYVCVRARKF